MPNDQNEWHLTSDNPRVLSHVRGKVITRSHSFEAAPNGHRSKPFRYLKNAKAWVKTCGAKESS